MIEKDEIRYVYDSYLCVCWVGVNQMNMIPIALERLRKNPCAVDRPHSRHVEKRVVIKIELMRPCEDLG